MTASSERIVVYGKGGVGKSVVATALSVHFAQTGAKVLHVGCDPKHDSAFRLSSDGNQIRTVLEILGDDPAAVAVSSILNRGRLGIDCCEAGGPRPGLGCGGRGVARTIEFLDEMEVIDSGNYDAVVFDVLGDVVCGGFAAPLRRGFAEKVVIVTSEEPMALYAANNISRAIEVYRGNGVALAGLVANLRGPEVELDMLAAFAERLSTRILSTIPRDPRIMDAERKCLTILEHAPGSEASSALRALAVELESIDPAQARMPTPLSDQEFYAFMELW